MRWNQCGYSSVPESLEATSLRDKKTTRRNSTKNSERVRQFKNQVGSAARVSVCKLGIIKQRELHSQPNKCQRFWWKQIFERKTKKKFKSFPRWTNVDETNTTMSSNKSKVRPNAAIVFGFVLAFVCATITAFNVDTVNYIRHEGEVDSMFGFSVALHQEQQRSWWVSNVQIVIRFYQYLLHIRQFGRAKVHANKTKTKLTNGKEAIRFRYYSPKETMDERKKLNDSCVHFDTVDCMYELSECMPSDLPKLRHSCQRIIRHRFKGFSFAINWPHYLLASFARRCTRKQSMQ